jgi:galactokinase
VSSCPVKLPSGVSFVVANSLTRSAKAETVYSRFNKRVFEGKVALRLLRNKLTPEKALGDPACDTFAQLKDDLGHMNWNEIIDCCKSILSNGVVKKPDIVALVGQEVIDFLLDGKCGRGVWDFNTEFSIQSRAVHTYSEARRVGDFIAAARLGDVVGMAWLMNESGESCDADYDCSSKELRRLISAMKEAGCLGARLTGAGWGGCAVGMVETQHVEKVLDRIRENFYAGKSEIELNELVFAFEPVGGAFLTEVSVAV